MTAQPFDITIPPEALEAGVRAMIVKDSGPAGSRLFEIHWAEFSDTYRESLRAACLAMLNAWPGLTHTPAHHRIATGEKQAARISLPLPQQEGDA